MNSDKIFIEVKAFGLTHMAELPNYAKAEEFIDTIARKACHCDRIFARSCSCCPKTGCKCERMTFQGRFLFN